VTTAAQMVEATRWHLLTGQVEAQNRLTTTVTSGDTTLAFDFELGGIRAGSVLHLGLESVLVWAVTSETGRTVQVQRGFNGTTAAAHTAGDLVEVNPRFPTVQILNALNDELRGLSAKGLYRVGTVDRTYLGTARAFDLASDFIDVLEVSYDADSITEDWPLITDFSVQRDLPTADFPSGASILVRSRMETNRTVRVKYKRSFGMLTALTDDVETVTGLWVEAHDIPPLGAASILSAARDIRRTDTLTQGDTRRAQEVPAGTPQGAARVLQQRQSMRIGEEQGRLYQRYPLRRARY
jgi:hypothetical protein